MKDKLEVYMLPVGHGDSILIRLLSKDIFTILVDGGPNPDVLIYFLDDLGVTRIDRLVLTHVDADHIDGLFGIPGKVDVETFFCPCIAAFERNEWLFPDRIKDALNKARELEQRFRELHTNILCPLEGYTDACSNGTVLIEVLSPAKRLVERW